MALIGLLPASGKASRVGGIPKFCLPVSPDQCLLQWHVEAMKQVCDVVKVSTRAMWIPIVQAMNLDVQLMVREPSTMSEAVQAMMRGHDKNDTFVIGMPDTFILNATGNYYRQMVEEEGDVVLAAWRCTVDLQGRVGQIRLDGRPNRVIESRDKDPNCHFEHMWGAMVLRGPAQQVDPVRNHPGEQLQEWIDDGFLVKAVRPDGAYCDIGNFDGLKQFYRDLP
jgi:hypothetical protein